MVVGPLISMRLATLVRREYWDCDAESSQPLYTFLKQFAQIFTFSEIISVKTEENLIHLA